jgi:hypothetical protein
VIVASEEWCNFEAIFETTGECVDESGAAGGGIVVRAAVDGGRAACRAEGAESSAGLGDHGWVCFYKWCSGAGRLDDFSGRHAEDK